MSFIRRIRNQNWLFPPSIANLIEEDHICRLVDEVVEGIDLKRIEKRYDGPGSPAYHPKVMMKLLIQGTIDGIRSSRKISKATKENVVYMYLSDRLKPDFRTICRFRKDNLEFSFEYFDKHKGKKVRVYRGAGCAQCLDKTLCTKSKRKPKLIKCYGNEANMREMAEKMESPEGLGVYRMRAKTVERRFGHVKQNIGLREFLTRDLQGVRAEFSLACIAHNLKRIWKIKSQIEDIGVSPTEDGRFDQTFLKSLCGRIKRVGSNFLCSLSKSLRRKAIIECFKVNYGTGYLKRGTCV